MTERGLPLADGATACPFVAFEDDRDERASVPDHRHRCYAELRPAPRALAHQEAYCLSSAFPVCPTFQDWARREAARARGEAAAGRAGRSTVDDTSSVSVPSAPFASAAATDAAVAWVADSDDPPAAEPPREAAGAAPDAAAMAGGDPADDHRDGGDDRSPDDRDDDDPWSRPNDRGEEPIRNPPRDWAAPPPWLASSESAGAQSDAEPPAFLGRRPEPGAGLAGSPADRMAGGPPPTRRSDGSSAAWTAAAAAGAGAAAAGATGAGSAGAGGGGAPPADDDEYRVVDAPPGRVARRPRAYDQHLGGPGGPDWEQPRRYEAYPTIKTRVGMPEVPRLVLMAGAIALLAVALFFLPGFLNLGGSGGTPAASVAPSAAPSSSVAPTEPPAPTPVVYTIKKGDTLTKIAKAHGLTLEELMTANPDIKNPNKVSEGQQIVIPAPSEAPPDDEVTGSAAPSGAP